MNWKFELKRMSWKFKMLMVLALGFATVVFIKFPASQAQQDSETVTQQDETPIVEGKTSRYANGVSKVEPEAFGITPPLRDMPNTVPDASEKSARFVSRQQRKDIERQELQRKRGLSEKEIALEEINRQNAKRIKKVLPGAGAGDGVFRDPLVGRNAGPNAPQAMPTPSLTFNGASQVDNAAQGIGAVLPPDVNGDVGLNHYVSSVNLVLKIFNKTGTVAAGPIPTSNLFSGLPAGDPCRTLNDGDPIVIYDTLADRWHISQFAVPGNPNNYQCVAVSVTGDPTGAYYVWSYLYPNQIFNDYPKVGVWLDGYHMTFNQFNNAGTAFLGMGFLTQDRAKALAGDPTASVVYTNIATIDPNAGGGLPADIDGFVPPPTGMAEVIAEYRSDEFGDTDSIRYYRWVPNFAAPGSSTVSVLPDVALAPFDARAPASRAVIEQSGGANLDAISDRLMHRFAYRNLGTQAAAVNSFTGNFTVNVSGVNPTTAGTFQTGIRWFEMRRTGDAFSVFDQGTLTSGVIDGATGLNNWMGSIAQDNKGNIALGFSQSSSTQNADIKIAGRTNNVANSGTLNEGEAIFFDALGSQTSTSSRWGDYSAMNLDPVDDCTFWYTQEYYAATSSAGWSTRVGKFVFPGCTPAPKATIQGTVTNCSTGAPLNTASVTATGGFNRSTGAPGTYSMTVTPGTYTVTATKLGGYTGGTNATVTVGNGGTGTANVCLTPVAVVSSNAPQVVSESCSVANSGADPGEDLIYALPLQNTGAASTSSLTATLQATGGVVNPGPAQFYGAIAPGGAAVTKNFNFRVNPALACGSTVTLTWVITDGATNLGNVSYTISTGGNGAAATTSYTGPAVAVPDNTATGVNVTLPVSGVTAPIGDLNFRLDALAGCDAVAGNANASMTHTYTADLRFTLTSPSGTTVNLITERGGAGNNFCTILLDDDGGFPAAATIPTAGGGAGSFAPESPLSAFDGQSANGNWVLNVADVFAVDTGTINRFSLIITPKVCSTTCVQGVEADISSRPGGNGLIQSNDVVQMLRFLNEIDTPATSPNEFQRADSAPRTSKGNGAIDSGDIIQTVRYLNELDALGLTGGVSTPGGGPIAPPSNNRSPNAPGVAPEIRVENGVGNAGSQAVINMRVDAIGNEAQYAFALQVDPAVLTYSSFGSGSTGSGTFTCNAVASTPGRVRCSIGSFPGNLAGTDPVIGEIAPGNNQLLIRVNFTIAAGAAANTMTPVTLNTVSASSEDPNTPITVATTNGAVIVNGPTAAAAQVEGRVTNRTGRAISGATVTMTDEQGNPRTARSNGFGYFRFDEVASGATYIFQVRAKRYQFSQSSQVRSITQDVNDLNFVADSN